MIYLARRQAAQSCQLGAAEDDGECLQLPVRWNRKGWSVLLNLRLGLIQGFLKERSAHSCNFSRESSRPGFEEALRCRIQGTRT